MRFLLAKIVDKSTPVTISGTGVSMHPHDSTAQCSMTGLERSRSVPPRSKAHAISQSSFGTLVHPSKAWYRLRYRYDLRNHQCSSSLVHWYRYFPRCVPPPHAATLAAPTLHVFVALSCTLLHPISVNCTKSFLAALRAPHSELCT